MEIKIGEYVRTKEGYIYKIVKKIDLPDVYEDVEGYWVTETDIKAHSKYIVDIIEEGDCVNEHRVIGIGGNFVILECAERFVPEYEIETILTHELYEENSYKVVE